MKIARIFIYFLTIQFSAIAVNAQCVPVSTAAGALDTCFDSDGKLTTSLSAGVDEAKAIIVQPDQKILVAGVANRSNGMQDEKIALVRYNPNGSLDTSFDSDGIVLTNLSVAQWFRESANAIALQSDGKIVVAGSIELNTNNHAVIVLRYNGNGSLDTSFDGDGYFVWDVAPSNSDRASAVAIQPDGKIVVAGTQQVSSQTVASIVARFNPNGSFDTSFDTDGWTIVNGMSFTNAVALQTDGKIVIAGSSSFHLGGVARLNPNGSPDMFFGNNGVAVYSFANARDEAFAMKIRVDGSIFAAGISLTGGNLCGSLLRFGTDGAPGASFIDCNEFEFRAMAFQPDLKFVTAGRSVDPDWGFAVRRFIDADLIDTPFGTSGKVLVQFAPGNPNEFSLANGIAVQRDNKIVVAGMTSIGNAGTPAQFAIARLYSGLQPPHPERFDFDGDGKADVSVYRPSERKWYVFRSTDFGVTERVFGEGPYVPVPADYDGDGKTDFALFYPNGGDWLYISSLNGNTGGFSRPGMSGDIPRPSDFDGDGKTDFVVFRPTLGFWFRTSAHGSSSDGQFGLNGDKPVIGDFDGDGKSDKAIYRPSTGDWWYQSSINNAQLAVHWGISTDIPAPADYDGDGKADFAVYRPETGVWYIINSSNFSFTIINFGLAEDKPVPADYDGDGKADIAVFRPSTGVWYMLRSTAGFAAMQFGISSDIPLPNAYVP